MRPEDSTGEIARILFVGRDTISNREVSLVCIASRPRKCELHISREQSIEGYLPELWLYETDLAAAKQELEKCAAPIPASIEVLASAADGTHKPVGELVVAGLVLLGLPARLSIVSHAEYVERSIAGRYDALVTGARAGPGSRIPAFPRLLLDFGGQRLRLQQSGARQDRRRRAERAGPRSADGALPESARYLPSPTSRLFPLPALARRRRSIRDSATFTGTRAGCRGIRS